MELIFTRAILRRIVEGVGIAANATLVARHQIHQRDARGAVMVEERIARCVAMTLALVVEEGAVVFLTANLPIVRP